eukprot:881808-Rhodomonas_salina.2
MHIQPSKDVRSGRAGRYRKVSSSPSIVTEYRTVPGNIEPHGTIRSISRHLKLLALWVSGQAAEVRSGPGFPERLWTGKKKSTAVSESTVAASHTVTCASLPRTFPGQRLMFSVWSESAFDLVGFASHPLSV